MKYNLLHGANLEVSCLGLGTVKFGRNEQVKYPTAFDLPDDKAIRKLLDLARAEGINLLDTAPAYGTSEIRLGQLLGPSRDEWVIVTKAGEEFIDGRSVFDFSGEAITKSVERTLRRLRTDRIECVLLHSDGNDEAILRNSGAVEALRKMQEDGKILAIGISTKTVEGGKLAVEMGLDVVMITYNPWYRDEEPVLDLAAEKRDVSILIKKAFGSGWFGNEAEAVAGDNRNADPVATALDFIFRHPAATSVITGTLNPEHLKENAAALS